MRAGPPEKIVPGSLDDYLEIMTKSVFQSGMSWKVVEKKWPGIRDAFHGFDVYRVAGLDGADIDELMEDKRVIRNFRKLNAIVYNAKKMIELDKEYGSFRAYLRSHDGFGATLDAIRSDFKFLGPTGIYAFLYIVGEDVIPHAQFEREYRKQGR